MRLWLNRYFHDAAYVDDKNYEDDDCDGVTEMIANKRSAEVKEFVIVAEVVAVGVHVISMCGSLS